MEGRIRKQGEETRGKIKVTVLNHFKGKPRRRRKRN
jgi:hypothetical protein